MRDIGCSEEEIFSSFSRYKEKDTPYHRILSSMCTRPHPIAARAHAMFMETNLGDPGLFMGTASLEHLLIKRLGDLLHHHSVGGYATSGGTESNIQALRIAKKIRPVERPNVIMPESGHFSFDKACDLLSIDIRAIPLDGNFRIQVDQIEDQIDQNTIGVIAVAGTTEYGIVDPVRAVAEIAKDHGLFCHVDAAFGGLVLPFLDQPVPFDFSIPEVDSISVDPHKMGMSTIPTGCLLVRDTAHLSLLNIPTPYLTVKQEYTLMGTRSGGAVAGALAVLEYLGRSGMRAVVSGCMKNTRRLIDGMDAYGFAPAAWPDVNVATFECPRPPAGWHVSWTRRGHLRIVCMPHVHREMIEAFLEEVGEMCA
ncbi:MAG: tyrosine decarboxylase MfnA [Methanomicrobiales archaeon]|nr:tyrosine decarboxylase MfnA [Methanomicrobiales archaeon]